ncbi:hypothetical protein [Sinomonas notoginsengisoli]|uniref:hypothetical protein n=1 Tax=Sinomonas notoginsengisoli TaxID=1457311 RepID=UPI001F2B36DA|nr:hypothetical protein [Sinomonas notoginsengisoli]
MSETSSSLPLASTAAVGLRNPCPVSVAADLPAFNDLCGTERDAVIVPRIIGVDYLVGGSTLAPGPNAAIGTVTVEAVAQPGYSLSQPSQWTHTFTADPCPTVPEPAALAPSLQPLDAESPSHAAPAPAGKSSEQPGSTAAGTAHAAQTVTPQHDDVVTRRDDRVVQASVGGPGPLAWGIMIGVAVAGGILFWFKTRH